MGPQAIACGDRKIGAEAAEKYIASMGPQAIACGDRGAQEAHPRGHPASMGPQAIACGDLEPERGSGPRLGASMGPQAIACGDEMAYMPTRAQFELQWGRRQSPAEIFNDRVVSVPRM